MAISRQTLTELRRLLLELYDDPQLIRMVAEDAGLNVVRINMGGSAVNIWHAVLGEAQKVSAINTLINTVLTEYPQQEQAFCALLGSDFVPTARPAAPAIKNQPAPVTAVLTTPQQPAPPVTPITSPAAPLIPIEQPRTLRLTHAEQQLLSTLLRTASRLRILSEFTDGRTATRVFLIRPTDRDEVEELPAVVKIGPQALIEPEWQATQRHVLSRLPGFAAIQGEPIYLAQPNGSIMGALRYGQVGDGVFAVESLASYLAKASLIDSWHVLENRLFRQLGQLWRATLTWQPLLVQNSYDAILPVNLIVAPVAASAGTPSLRLDGNLLVSTVDPVPTFRRGDLVEITNFVITEIVGDEITLNLPQAPNAPRTAYRLRLQGAPGDYQVGATLPATLAHVTTTREEILFTAAQAQLGQVDLTQSTLTLPGSPARQLPNPLLALSTLLTQGHAANFATIHGDLNLRNVLVDAEARTTHIIDCAAARQDHAIQDLLRMERDYVTDVLAKLCFEADLPATTIVRLYQCVHCAMRGTPATGGHFSLPTDLPPMLHKAFVLLVTLRRAARELLARPGQWAEYYTGLIIHLLGALKFRDLDNAPAGQQPKALAFWGAAVTLDLLQELQSGQTRTCRDINWRFFDVTKGESPDVISKGITPADPTAAQSLGLEDSGLDHSSLESFTPDATAAPTADDLPPVQRRLDVAAPEQATLGRAFSLAVAVRQLTSPTLQLADLPLTRSGQALLDWPAAERFIRLRAEVIAPECEIVGAASYTFKLYRNLDSELSYFSLIPKVTGRLSIIVRLYQEDDMLGSALTHTVVSEQVVGEVGVQLRSEQVTTKVTPRTDQLVAADPPSGRPIKILFLAANPLDTVFLRTDEEARAIDAALRQAANRNFDIRVHGAVRSDDLQDLLLRHQPDIVHFSGHGTEENELILVDANGKGVAVNGAALRNLFGVLKGNIRCIVLNACYTEAQAQALAEVIDCVVGIEDVISDEGARQFATAFYRALGYEKSIGDAFALGKNQIELAGLGEAEALHLLTRTGEAGTFTFADVSNDEKAKLA